MTSTILRTGLAKLAAWGAQQLVGYALQRAFGGKQSIIYRQIDRQLPAVGPQPSRVQEVIEGAIALAQGRPATPLEQRIVRLAYDPVKAAISLSERL
jgi:hypothetical protein